MTAPERATDILLLGGGRWHAEELVRAFAGRGLVARRAGFDALEFAHDAPLGVRLGDGGPPPRAVLVRSIPAGSFEQITFRLALLHALAAGGVAVFNDAAAIERSVDKAATSVHLARAGLPTPPFWTTSRRERAVEILEGERRLGHALVVKPLFGAQGQGVAMVRRPEDLPGAEEVAGVWYLQRYVGHDRDWHDYRVLVVDGVAVACMRRRGRDWITNIRRGARPEAVTGDVELERLAVAAAAVVGTFYAGVDILRDGAGRCWILEVNSMPAWKGLQSVCPFPIADRLAAAIRDRLERDDGEGTPEGRSDGLRPRPRPCRAAPVPLR